MDDMKASHATQEALDEFAEWVQELYGEYSDVKVTRGKEHDYDGTKYKSTTLLETSIEKSLETPTQKKADTKKRRRN